MVTFLNLNTLQKITLIPLYPVTPVLVNTPIVFFLFLCVSDGKKSYSQFFNVVEPWNKEVNEYEFLYVVYAQRLLDFFCLLE